MYQVSMLQLQTRKLLDPTLGTRTRSTAILKFHHMVRKGPEEIVMYTRKWDQV